MPLATKRKLQATGGGSRVRAMQEMNYAEAIAIVRQQLIDSHYMASMRYEFHEPDEMQSLFDLADEKRDAP